MRIRTPSRNMVRVDFTLFGSLLMRPDPLRRSFACRRLASFPRADPPLARSGPAQSFVFDLLGKGLLLMWSFTFTLSSIPGASRVLLAAQDVT